MMMEIAITLLLISQLAISEARNADENTLTLDANPQIIIPNLRSGHRRRLGKKNQGQKRGKREKWIQDDPDHELNLFRHPTINAVDRGKTVNRKKVRELLAYLHRIKDDGLVNKPEVEEMFETTFHMSIQEVVFTIERDSKRLSYDDLQLLQFLRNVVDAFNAYDFQISQAQRASVLNSVPAPKARNYRPRANGRSNRAHTSAAATTTTTTSNTVSAENAAYDHDYETPDIAQIVEEELQDNPEVAEIVQEEMNNPPNTIHSTAQTYQGEDDDEDEDEDEDEDDDLHVIYNDGGDDEDDDDEYQVEYAAMASAPLAAPPFWATPDSSAPSSAPSYAPSKETLKPLTLVDDDGEDIHWLGECEGDCDYNSDCNVGLVCGWRNHEGDDDGVDAFVPGCSLDPREIGEGSEDFCYKPQDPNTVVIMADRELSLGMENYPLQRCQGDCWSDDDCVGDLICIYFDEDVHDPADCVGWAEEKYSYCLEPLS